MRKSWKQQILLSVLAALILMTVGAAAAEPEDVGPLAEEPVIGMPEAEEPETVLFDEARIDLDVTDWADVGDAVSLLGGELAQQSGYLQMKQELVAGIRAKQAEIAVTNRISGLTMEQLSQLYFNMLYSNPEETWFARSEYRRYYPLNGSSYALGETIRILPAYMTDCDFSAYTAAVDTAVSECFAPGMTDLEKIVAAHDWIVLNCQYDPYVANGKNAYTAADGVTYGEDEKVYTSYGVFVDGNAVCQGYALAFKVLMDRANVPCSYVDGEGHAWDIVQLDGIWYYVDSTWDDPVNIGTTGDFAGMVERDDFLKGEAAFQTSHQKYASWTNEYGYAVSEEDFSLPEGLANAAEMAAYLMDGHFYLIDNSGTLYQYAVGGGFESGTPIARGLSTRMRAAAMDAEENVLYCLFRDYEYISGQVIWYWKVSGIDLKAAAPAPKEIISIQDTDSKWYGLRIRDSREFSGAKELCLWYDYAAEATELIGVDTTDEDMPVTIQYASAILKVTNLVGKSISVEAGKDCTVYLACYDANGKMLRVTSLGTAAAGETATMTISRDAVASNTNAAGIMAIDQSLRIPLASVIKSVA